MINIIIYLNQVNEAKELIDTLLSEDLIANASIDISNVSYSKENNEIIKNVNTVITAQTKSMLFSTIVEIVGTKYGAHVPIFSMPITQANSSFDHIIRNHTKKI
jgi:uncharacterized protein involved in tolerance to divalent cations